MTLLDDLATLLGPSNVLTGPDLAKYTGDWSGHYKPNPCAVARPANTAEVSAVIRCAARHNTPIIPVSGLTGLVGGAMTNGGLMLSLTPASPSWRPAWSCNPCTTPPRRRTCTSPSGSAPVALQ
jgi:hypothetical protein